MYGLQVKEKYDTVAQLWASLPTDAELLQRQSLTAEQMVRRRSEVLFPGSRTHLIKLHWSCTPSPFPTPTQHYSRTSSSTDSTDDGNPLSGLSEDESSFCTRFQLSPDELPLPSWISGRRCTLLDKDRPLIGSKSGKLFVTHRWVNSKY